MAVSARRGGRRRRRPGTAARAPCSRSRRRARLRATAAGSSRRSRWLPRRRPAWAPPTQRGLAPTRLAPSGGMAHAHHDHVGQTADSRRLSVALALILAFMAAEVVVGLLASSLALLSDAAHMLTDAGALALALLAARLARRPAGGGFTFGLRRAEILSAQVNGAAILSGAERRSLNVEGAFQHVLTDLFAFVATAIAGVVVLATGFSRADGIAALLVAALMLRSGYGLLRDSGRVLLEAAPRGLDPDEIGRTLAAEHHVVEVHDLHVWEVTSGMPSLSAHVTVRAGCGTPAHRRPLA